MGLVTAISVLSCVSSEPHVYSGCFRDRGPTGSNQTAHGRQMKHQVCEVTGEICSALTRERCAATCRDAGYTHFGVEAGHQCYCDSSLVRSYVLSIFPSTLGVVALSLAPSSCCSPVSAALHMISRIL